MFFLFISSHLLFVKLIITEKMHVSLLMSYLVLRNYCSFIFRCDDVKKSPYCLEIHTEILVDEMISCKGEFALK